jgi:hypothetical protein
MEHPMFRSENVRRTVADNLRRSYAIPATIGDADILALYEVLSDMTSDELDGYLKEEQARLNGDWHALIKSNIH